MTENDDSQLAESAVDLAIAGLRVFPCWSVTPSGCACGKDDCDRAGKHPVGRLAPKGLHDATDDEDLVRAWWAQYPGANVGVRGGSGLVIVDCDLKHDGPRKWRELVESKGGSLETAVVRTGGGGLHYYYACDEDLHIASPVGLVVDGMKLDGIDIRGSQAYAIAPPSRHQSGASYVWQRDLRHLRDAPPWLLQLVAGDADSDVDERKPLAPIPTGDFPMNAHEARDIRAALEHLSPDLDHDSWLKVGLALHDRFHGHAIGLELWDTWSAPGATYPGSAALRKRWRSFGRKRLSNPVGISSLFHLARESGYRGIPYDPARDCDSSGKLELEKHEIIVASATGCGVRAKLKPGGKLDIAKGTRNDLDPGTRRFYWAALDDRETASNVRIGIQALMGAEELGIYHAWKRHARRQPELRNLDIFELHEVAERNVYVVPSPDPIARVWKTAQRPWFSTVPDDYEPLLLRPDGENYMLRGFSGILSAPGGTGKSTAALQLAVSLITGRPWLDIYEVGASVLPGSKVAYLGGEHTPSLIHQALLNISEELELDESEQAALEELLVPLPLLGEGFHVLRHDGYGNVTPTPAFETLEAQLYDHAGDEGFAAVIVDTVNRLAGVEVEVSNDLAARFIEALETLTLAPGTPAILALHHTSKQDQTVGRATPRGATALKDNPRFVAEMLKSDGDRIRLSNSMNNLCPEDEPRFLVRSSHGVLRAERDDERVQREAEAKAALLERVSKKAADRDLARDNRIGKKVSQVVELVTQEPGINTTKLRVAVGGSTRDAADAIERAIHEGRIRTESGPRRVRMHYPAS